MTRKRTQFTDRGGADNLIYGETASEQEMPLSATFGGHLLMALFEDRFNAMLKELKRINFHLSLITGVSSDETDLGGQ